MKLFLWSLAYPAPLFIFISYVLCVLCFLLALTVSVSFFIFNFFIFFLFVPLLKLHFLFEVHPWMIMFSNFSKHRYTCISVDSYPVSKLIGYSRNEFEDEDSDNPFVESRLEGHQAPINSTFTHIQTRDPNSYSWQLGLEKIPRQKMITWITTIWGTIVMRK